MEPFVQRPAFRCALPLFVVALGCSSSSPSTDAGAAGEGGVAQAGGPVMGAMDKHCAGKVQETSQAVCHLPVPDAGAPGPGQADAGDMPEFGETMFNSEGDDDDCKYHVGFTVAPIFKDKDVTFTVKVTRSSDGKPATGANLQTEIFLTTMTSHISPSMPRMTESPPGTYKVGPIKFDAAGRWTVRFHLFQDCTDADEASPHGHAAFFIDVF
jgi:hypothetical protein